MGAALDRGDLAAAATPPSERGRSIRSRSSRSSPARSSRSDAATIGAALAAYREAVRLQPENPEAWLELGLFEFDRGDRCSAYIHLNEAYTLDPAGTQWVPGGPLDQALGAG